MLIFFALAVVIAIFASMFALQNADVVRVSFMTAEFSASLALVLFATFALGALGALLACLPAVLKGRLKVYDLKKKIAELEGQTQTSPPPAATTSSDSTDESPPQEPPTQQT
jgi:putative membrane protein